MKKYWEIVITNKDGSNAIWDAKNKKDAHKQAKEAAKEYGDSIDCITVQAHNGEEILDDTQVRYSVEELLKG